MRGDEQESEEWVRRIDEAEAGHASAADIERLYYALKSCPETGRDGAWCSVASGYARIAALPYAPVSVLRALTYDALHVTSNKTYARTAGQVVNKLGDNATLGGQGTSGRRHVWCRRDQLGGSQTRKRGPRM